MISVFLKSSFFTICGLIFWILLCIIYKSKNSYNTKENRYFKISIILDGMLLFNELGYMLAITNKTSYPAICEIVCKLYFIIALFCIILFALYILSIIGEDFFENFKLSFIRIFLIILVFATLGSCVGLPLEYMISNYNTISVGGPASYGIYGVGFIIILCFLIKAFIERKKLPKRNYSAILFCMAIFFGTTIYAVITGNDANTLSCSFVLILLTTYFTFECQDGKLVEEYEVLKKEYDRNIKDINNLFLNSSHDIKATMYNISGYSTEVLEKISNNNYDIVNDLKTISHENNIINELKNNFSNIYKINNKIYEVQNKEVELDSLINSIKLSLNNINLIVNKTGNINKIKVDENVILVMLKNLVDGVVDHNKDVNLNITSNDNKLSFSITNISSITSEEFAKYTDIISYSNDLSNNFESPKFKIVIAHYYARLLNSSISFEKKDNLCIYTIDIDTENI